MIYSEIDNLKATLELLKMLRPSIKIRAKY